MQGAGAAEARETARVILFKDGDEDKAVGLVCEGAAAKFVQEISDMVLSEAEADAAGDFLSGGKNTMQAAPNGEKEIRGGAHGGRKGTRTATRAAERDKRGVRDGGRRKQRVGGGVAGGGGGERVRWRAVRCSTRCSTCWRGVAAPTPVTRPTSGAMPDRNTNDRRKVLPRIIRYRL